LNMIRLLREYASSPKALSGMSHLQRNAMANLIGRIWSKVLGLVFIPLYIKFLGMEAFGLVGFYMTLVSVLSLADLGVGGTLNRELARLSAVTGSKPEQRDLLRTLESICWSQALFLGVLIFWLSPMIAHHWVKSHLLSVAAVERGVSLMGFAFLFQFPLSFYQTGLMGKQRQVLVNAIQGIVAMLQGFGAVLLLWLVSPTIECFFVWQIVVAILGTGITAYFLWRSLEAPSKARLRFRLSLLRRVWSFAAGWTGFAVTQAIAFQGDKVILSKILSLDLFGYYVLAQTIAMTIWAIVESVTGAALPRLSQLAMLEDQNGLKTTFHRSTQFMAVILMPVAAILALFSWEIVMLWVRNGEIADQVYLLSSVLITGVLVRGLASIPLCVQIAYGWFRLTLSASFVSAICFLPLIAWMAARYGALGAALAAAAQHAVYFFAMPLMHYRYLKGEQWHWLLGDVLRPLAVVLLVTGAGRLLYPAHPAPLASLAYLAAVWLASAGTAAFVASEVRGAMLSLIPWGRLRAGVD
jgi:O-antigen/teichoic acid export membrane protein